MRSDAAGPLPQPTPRGQALVRDLQALLGAGSASCEPADLWAAGRDASARSRLSTKAGLSRFVPDAVVWPRDGAQVAELIQFAGQQQLPLVPMGGGSSVCGASLPVRGGVLLDTKRMQAAPRIDLASGAVDVRAGQSWARLEEQLRASGATLGVQRGLRAGGTVGGLLATRGGSGARHGKVEDLVLSLEAVDGNGALLRTIDGPTVGPDLAQLLLGSEGTLCVFAAARLRITQLPRARLRRAVRCRNFETALRAAQAIARAGLRPSRLEALDPLSTALQGLGGGPLTGPLRLLARSGRAEAVQLLLRTPRLTGGLLGALSDASLLLLEFEGTGPFAEEEAEEELASALRLCTGPASGGDDLGAAAAEAPLNEREGASLPVLLGAGAFLEPLDVAATWDRLPGLHEGLRRACEGRALLFARLSDAAPEGGALDCTLLGPPGVPVEAALSTPQADRDELEDAVLAEERAAEECLAAALSAASDAGATISHHRGIGLHRALQLPRELGEGLRALRALKRAFDPRGILNPGKLLL